jgi:hypothetical protein
MISGCIKYGTFKKATEEAWKKYAMLKGRPLETWEQYYICKYTYKSI